MKFRLRGKSYELSHDEIWKAVDETHDFKVYQNHGSWCGKFVLKKGLTNEDFVDALIRHGHLIKED